MPEKAPPDTSRLLLCPMPGLVVRIDVAEGDEVHDGQALCMVEAMKMENVLRAERRARVAQVRAQARRQPRGRRRDHGVRVMRGSAAAREPVSSPPRRQAVDRALMSSRAVVGVGKRRCTTAAVPCRSAPAPKPRGRSAGAAGRRRVGVGVGQDDHVAVAQLGDPLVEHAQLLAGSAGRRGCRRRRRAAGRPRAARRALGWRLGLGLRPRRPASARSVRRRRPAAASARATGTTAVIRSSLVPKT